MDGLDGKTAIVTGAGSGIGRASARRLAAEGANVVVADVDKAGGTKTVERIERDGGDAAFVQTDVSDANDVATMVDVALDEYGSLDLAHNNAGIDRGAGPITEIDEGDWERTIDVNLRGVWLCMKHELPHLDTGGAIVNTASTAGLVGAPGIGHYTASKHGVVGLTKSAALEHAGREVRVNAICPGIVDTAMARENGDALERVAESTPMGRAADPDEVASVAAWLCSSDASFVTGIAMPVDGGMLTGRM